MFRNSKLINSTATILAILLSILIAFYAIYLIFVGARWETVPETIFEDLAQGIQPEVTIERIPYPPALVPLVASLLLLFGLIGQNKVYAWVGLSILLVFSLLFFFGNGGTFLPAAYLLLIFLFLIFFSQKKRTDNFKQLLSTMTTIAILLTIIVVILAFWLLYGSYYLSISYILASVLLLFGLIGKEKLLVLAWIGSILLLVFSILLLFSSGAAFLPIAGLILVLLLIITIIQKKRDWTT